MTIVKTDGTCLGAYRLCAIDCGFDPRSVGMRILMPREWPDYLATPGEHDHTGVGFDLRDGGRAIVWGTREEVARVLTENGYTITYEE